MARFNLQTFDNACSRLSNPTVMVPDVVRIPVGLEHIDDILCGVDQAPAAASR